MQQVAPGQGAHGFSAFLPAEGRLKDRIGQPGARSAGGGGQLVMQKLAQLRVAEAEQALGGPLAAGAQVTGESREIVLLIEHGIHFCIEAACAMARPS
ncbi:hypothetical protein D3C86_1997430 [compost metagenome]